MMHACLCFVLTHFFPKTVRRADPDFASVYVMKHAHNVIRERPSLDAQRSPDDICRSLVYLPGTLVSPRLDTCLV